MTKQQVLDLIAGEVSRIADIIAESARRWDAAANEKDHPMPQFRDAKIVAANALMDVANEIRATFSVPADPQPAAESDDAILLSEVGWKCRNAYENHKGDRFEMGPTNSPVVCTFRVILKSKMGDGAWLCRHYGKIGDSKRFVRRNDCGMDESELTAERGWVKMPKKASKP